MTIEYPFYGRIHELLFRTFRTDLFLGEPLGEGRRRELALYLVFLHKLLALLLLMDTLPTGEQWRTVKVAILTSVAIALLAADIFLLPKQREVVAPNSRLDVIYGAIFAASSVGFIIGFLV